MPWLQKCLEIRKWCLEIYRVDATSTCATLSSSSFALFGRQMSKHPHCYISFPWNHVAQRAQRPVLLAQILRQPADVSHPDVACPGSRHVCINCRVFRKRVKYKAKRETRSHTVSSLGPTARTSGGKIGARFRAK